MFGKNHISTHYKRKTEMSVRKRKRREEEKGKEKQKGSHIHICELQKSIWLMSVTERKGITFPETHKCYS